MNDKKEIHVGYFPIMEIKNEPKIIKTTIEGNRAIGKFMGRDFKDPLNYMYDNSWDWQIEAWSKISMWFNSLKGLKKGEAIYLREEYANAVHNNKKEYGFKILVDAIKWYNQNKK